MKRILLLIFWVSSLMSSYVSAGTTDAYFDETTGKIVIPHLIINGATYYFTLSLADEANLTFKADLESFTDITPPEQVGDTVNIDVADIVGTWAFTNNSTRLTFNSDGSYEQVEAAGDDVCSEGGSETGTYTWAPSTGILLAVVQTDNNGECGLSDPRDGVPLRIFIDGNSMQILEKGDGIPLQEFSLKRT